MIYYAYIVMVYKFFVRRYKVNNSILIFRLNNNYHHLSAGKVLQSGFSNAVDTIFQLERSPRPSTLSRDGARKLLKMGDVLIFPHPTLFLKINGMIGAAREKHSPAKY